MIKVIENIFNDIIECEFKIELTSKNLYLENLIDIDVTELYINNEKSTEHHNGLITIDTEHKNALLTLTGKDIVKVNGCGINIDISDYFVELSNEIKLKKEKLRQNNKLEMREAYSSKRKFNVSRDDLLGYFIDADNVLNPDVIELANAMTKNDSIILEKYPEIQSNSIELTLKEIVDTIHFKKDN